MAAKLKKAISKLPDEKFQLEMLRSTEFIRAAVLLRAFDLFRRVGLRESRPRTGFARVRQAPAPNIRVVRFRSEEIWPSKVARQRRVLHNGRAVGEREGTRRKRHRSVRNDDRQAQDSYFRFEINTARLEISAHDRRLCVVEG